MDISTQLEAIKISNFNRKLATELDYWKESGNTNIFSNPDINVENRLKLLEKITGQPVKQHDTVQQQRDNIFKEIDKYTYKKQWNKLIPFHKIVKVKEYINENVKDSKMQKELIDKLSAYAEEGRINTKKFVIYDPNAEKILSMPCLVVDTNKNTYTLNVV